MKTITIGRSNTNDIVINESFVSAKHFAITLDNQNRYFLHDFNSTNGTFVNGQKVEQAYLNMNDIVRIGDLIIPWQSYFQISTNKLKTDKKVERKISFGRANTNNVVLNNEKVSSNHAVITLFDDGTFFIEDLFSTNGTFINNRKIKTSELHAGDHLMLGNETVDWYSYFKPDRKKIVARKNNKTLTFLLYVASILLIAVTVWYYFAEYRPKQNEQDLLDASESDSAITPTSFTELVAYAEQCVFLVETNRCGQTIGNGTGFFLSSAGIGISNHHVFNNGTSWRIKTKDNEIFEVTEILKRNQTLDFIIFRINNQSNKAFPFLRIAPEQPLKGEDIFVVGNPRGIAGTLSKGVVSAFREVNKNTESFVEGDTYIQFDAAISSGSSGSPVMNMKGQVVGMATLKIMECENCNFAINMKYIKPFLEEIPAN